MKLKKIASLMLAGVMAISMLAGCSNGGNDNGDGTVVAPSTAAGKVIAGLDKDTADKVTFATDTALETALQKMVKNAGVDTTKMASSELLKVNSKLATTVNGLDAVYTVDNKNSTEATDKKEETGIWVYVLDEAGVSEDYAVSKFINQIETNPVAYSWTAAGQKGDVVCSKLPEQSKTYVDADKNEYWYNFEYTGKVAVVEASNEVTGQSRYVVAYTVTRTPTKVEK